ncbi:DUF6042 family protein [Rhizomonospora bruguierae]|uniref:DUF6042 family protein n=1 Tax=Rhizomonospora bruguierae TaxID=1581705 RepID=UPI001BCE0B79|nr:DUF6042 family protein [Micromonospora sp. NBRC 107566]
MTARWQRATVAPSWVRWLPCAFAYLTVVPPQRPFRRSVWDEVVPWDEPVWCDPGDVTEWVSRARRLGRDRRDPAGLDARARAHYAQVVQLREQRIALFAEACRRLDVPVPHTLRDLLPCLAGFGLFTLADDGDGDPWVTTRLERDPLDLLPLVEDEIAAEREAQRADRALLVAIEIRKLVERGRGRWRRRSAQTTLPELAARSGVAPADLAAALTDLRAAGRLAVEVARAGGEPARLRVTVPWPAFGHQYPFDDLPAPEHGL